MQFSLSRQGFWLQNFNRHPSESLASLHLYLIASREQAASGKKGKWSLDLHSLSLHNSISLCLSFEYSEFSSSHSLGVEIELEFFLDDNNSCPQLTFLSTPILNSDVTPPTHAITSISSQWRLSRTHLPSARSSTGLLLWLTSLLDIPLMERRLTFCWA